MNGRPVQLIVSDDLQRSRLTVFFRLLLAIPHLIWLGLWGIAASVAVVVNWFATLIAGRSPDALHDFLAAYIRYAIHVGAYVLLAAEPFPDFLGKPGYPVDVTIAASQPQNRWKVGFRIVLAIPALIIGSALVSGSARSYGFNYSYGLAGIAAFLGWFVALAQARLPRGLRDLIAYGLSYSAQLDAYLFLLTDVYPDSNPLTALSDLPARAEDPVELELGAGLERSDGRRPLRPLRLRRAARRIAARRRPHPAHRARALHAAPARRACRRDGHPRRARGRGAPQRGTLRPERRPLPSSAQRHQPLIQATH